MTFPRQLLVILLAACCIGGGIVWSQRATSSTPKRAAKLAFPTHELEELDRVVQARFAVVPRDGSFGFSRILPPAGTPIEVPHGMIFLPSNQGTAAIAALRRSHQQVAFYLVGRKAFSGRRFTNGRVQGPVILPSSFWRTRAEVVKAQTEFKNVAASAPQNSQLCGIGDAVFAQAKPGDGAETQVKEWHVVARPVQASSMQCVTCHNSMARKAAASSGNPTEKPDLISLHDPLGIALYCVRAMPPSSRQQQVSR